MKIEFKKIPFNQGDFEADFGGVKLVGKFERLNPKLAKIEARLKGSIVMSCYRCGKEFDLDVDDDLSILLSDGIYKDEDSLDIIEVEDSIIDFDEIISSEIESIKSDYNSCGSCDNIEEFEF